MAGDKVRKLPTPLPINPKFFQRTLNMTEMLTLVKEEPEYPCLNLRKTTKLKKIFWFLKSLQNTRFKSSYKCFHLSEQDQSYSTQPIEGELASPRLNTYKSQYLGYFCKPLNMRFESLFKPNAPLQCQPSLDCPPGKEFLNQAASRIDSNNITQYNLMPSSLVCK